MKITPVHTSIGSPWQNGVAERWVGSCRRELLDNVIALNERHLKRLLSDYISYYHEDRTHLGLGKKTPSGRTPDFPRGPRHCAATTRRPAPPLRPRCLRLGVDKLASLKV